MVAKFIGIVKGQLDYWRYQVANFGPDHPRYRPTKIAKYQYLIRDFSELLEYLERQEGDQNPQSLNVAAPNVRPRKEPQYPSSFVPNVGFSHASGPGPMPVLAPTPLPAPERNDEGENDLSDLPPELLKELSENARGETDPIIKIINGRGGTASLDEVLIDLFRKYKEIGKRPIVANKLYRLAKRHLCWPVPGKKGTYTTVRPATSSGTDEGSSTTENEEDPGASTPGSLSNDHGDSRSPGGPSKATPVGSSPTISTKHRRELLAGSAIPPVRVPR